MTVKICCFPSGVQHGLFLSILHSGCRCAPSVGSVPLTAVGFGRGRYLQICRRRGVSITSRRPCRTHYASRVPFGFTGKDGMNDRLSCPQTKARDSGPREPPGPPFPNDLEGETSLMLSEDGRKGSTMGASSGSPRREWVVVEVRRNPNGASGPS